jgi:pimeloyl-ACP methyl ester carboxylesterase
MPFTNNKGVKIHYELDGNGPPLILAHGFGSDIQGWYKNGYAPELSKNYKLIIVDARGFGGSDKPHELKDYDADVVASDYTAILDDLKIDKANFYGYSMGGRFGFQAMARHALSRLSSLIIGGATPYGTVTEEERKETELRIAGLKLAVAQGMEAYIKAFYEKTYGSMPAEDRAANLANDPKALLAIRTAYEYWPRSDDIMPKMTLPILVFCGGADPRFPIAEECVRHMPNATFVGFPGFGHLQIFRKSELVLPHIKKFLAGANKK